jgi:PPOX class probable F420-dependent enzyme
MTQQTRVMFTDAAREVLDGPHLAVLSTVNADGAPQSTVIFVKREGDQMVFSTLTGRLKTRNMTRDPRVGLLVQRTPHGRYVAIRGTVEITDDPDKVLLKEMYDLRMGGATPPPEPGEERVIARITPATVYTFPSAA